MFRVLRLPAPKLIAVGHGLGLAVTQEDTGRVDIIITSNIIRTLFIVAAISSRGSPPVKDALLVSWQPVVCLVAPGLVSGLLFAPRLVMR